MGPFWGPFWEQIGPRRGQDEPKRAIKSFKDKKSYIFKNLKNNLFLKVFGVQRPSKRASGGPRGLPRGSQSLERMLSNNVGGNNNNNSQGQGGDAHDAAFCTEVRCGELIIRILRICPGVCL